MNTKEILINARKKIANGWTQGYTAVDICDFPVSMFDPAAVCFCAVGAVYSVLGPENDGQDYDIFKKMYSLLNIECLPAWNDDPARTKEEVLEAFDKVINSL